MSSIAEKLTTIAENEQKVYKAGKAVGVQEGIQTEYDRFWNNFQENGERTNYQFGFCGAGWNNENLKPKYKIILSNAKQMFQNMNPKYGQTNERYAIDFTNLNDYFDFSQLTGAMNTFTSAFIKNLYADLSNCDTLNQTFNCADGGGCLNTTIKVSEKTKFNNTFLYGGLTTVRFTEDSVIGQNGLSLTRQNNMSHDQLMSIINCLKDYSEDTSGTEWAVTLGETNFAKLTDEEKAIATEKGWTLA